jgi:multidrug resistance efflux pump
MTSALLQKHIAHAEAEVEEARRSLRRAQGLARLFGNEGTAQELGRAAAELAEVRAEVSEIEPE